MGYGTTAGKPTEQKTLFLCLINIHNFCNSDCSLVDISSNLKFDNIMSFHKIFWKKLLAFFI